MGRSLPSGGRPILGEAFPHPLFALLQTQTTGEHVHLDEMPVGECDWKLTDTSCAKRARK